MNHAVLFMKHVSEVSQEYIDGLGNPFIDGLQILPTDSGQGERSNTYLWATKKPYDAHY